MTHIDNIPHIFQHGITHMSSANSNQNFKPIGDNSLIGVRNEFLLSNGKKLGEYIPFYFGVRTPMLYVIQKGYNMVSPVASENVVYCVTSLEKILEAQLDYIFTDGHAIDKFTTQYYPDDIQNLDNLIDWKAVRAKFWKDDSDLDLKRRKEAEFLLLGDLPKKSILGFVVSNETAKNKIVELGVSSERVQVKSDYYF